MARQAGTDIPPASDLFERIVAQIDARMQELRPAVEEQEDLLRAAQALGLGVDEQSSAPSRRGRGRPRAASGPRGPRTRGGRASGPSSPRGATQQAIVDALEHGSHTLSELVVVTALSTAAIRKHVAALLDRGLVTRARREGTNAYALVNPPD